MTENTDPICGSERVIAAIAMPPQDDAGKDGDGAGTCSAGAGAWQCGQTLESRVTNHHGFWSVIDLKDGDEVLAAAEARDGDRHSVRIHPDSSLRHSRRNVRPQGRTAGGMASIRLATGCSVAAFAVVPAEKPGRLDV